MKEVARGLLSSPPGTALLHSITRHSPLPLDRRRWVYLKVGKKVRARPGAVFEHRERGGEPVRFHLAGIVRELYWVGAFEVEALPLFVEYARGSRCILDVGAAEGEYALLAASVSPDAVVFAFEPGSSQVRQLSANIGLNSPGPGDRVTVVEVALSDHRGTEQFFELPGGTSSLNPEFRADTSPRDVAVERGDDIVPSLVQGRRVDLVKIDTESTEPEVIAGLRGTIAADRPTIFCEVLRGRTEERLQALVDDLGYDTWWLGPDGAVRRDRIVGQPTYVNWLLLPAGTEPISGAAPDGTARAS